MSKPLVLTAVVHEVKSVTKEVFLVRLEEQSISRDARAGQFVEVKVPQCQRILWRRPFSVHDINPENHTFELLIKKIGPGTSALRKVTKNQKLDVIGMLGHPFFYSDHLKKAVIIAGGIGIAPFKLMLNELQQRQISSTLLYGVDRSDQLIPVDDYAENSDLIISTRDGSAGFQGLVTDLLVRYLDDTADLSGNELFVCGPIPMLKKVQEIAKHYRLPAQVSLETIMACGFGACVGCAVPMAHPIAGEKEYFLACQDGPVFDMHEIIIND